MFASKEADVDNINIGGYYFTPSRKFAFLKKKHDEKNIRFNDCSIVGNNNQSTNIHC